MSMLPPPLPISKSKFPKNQSPTPSTSSSSSSSVQIQNEEETLKQIIKEFEDYRFTEDPTFNDGLPNVFNAIRGKKMSPGLIDKTIAEAQWFYFTTRIKHTSIPFSTYTTFITRQPDHPTSSSPRPSSECPLSQFNGNRPKDSSDPSSLSRMNHLTEAMRMMETKGTEGQTGLTFDKLCELIKEGRADELKGKDIPDELNTSTPSQSTLSARPKPWQRNLPTSTVPQLSNQNLVDAQQNTIHTGPQTSYTTPYSNLPFMPQQQASPNDQFNFSIPFDPSLNTDFSPLSSTSQLPNNNQTYYPNFIGQNDNTNQLHLYDDTQLQTGDQTSTFVPSFENVETPGSEYINWSAGDDQRAEDEDFKVDYCTSR